LNDKISRFLHHPLSPFRRRTIISIAILVIVMIVGIEGMVLLERWSYVDAFYFMSLIATSQGPTRSPSTDGGKVFASAMAFVSVGAAISQSHSSSDPFSEHSSKKEWTIWRKRREESRNECHQNKTIP